MTATVGYQTDLESTSAPIVLISSDNHVGPLLPQLREYCPKALLDTFDDFAKEQLPPSPLQATEGHHDMHARIRDMNRDGCVGEVLFHGSQNGIPLPFIGARAAQKTAGFTHPFSFEGLDLEMVYAGMHIYNEWLADYVSVEPERHVGLAHIPAWDPEASAREAEWAADHGLRGINFPAMRPGMPPLHHEVWDRFYAVCAERGLPLANHGGAGDEDAWDGPGATALRSHESCWHSKRLMWWMILQGVFERHPHLKLVITEIPGIWWMHLLNELDSVGQVMTQLPRTASEYAATNVWHGATFISQGEAETAVRDGYWKRVLWGSDYPHIEGTWQAGDDTQTRLSLRYSFAGLPIPAIRAIAGENAMDVYGFDRPKMYEVAERIGAPTPDEVTSPLDEIPEKHGMFAFRTEGPWS